MAAKGKSGGSGWFIGCLVLAVVALVAVGGGVAYLITQIPDVTDQLPPDAVPLIVNITAPLNDANVAADDTTFVEVQAAGDRPIVALELWVDGALMQVKGAPPGSSPKRFNASWTWLPGGEGAHTLIARATDADKRVGTSSAVRVSSEKASNPVQLVETFTEAGDTVGSIAQRFKISPQKIVDLNPSVSPSATLPPSSTITIPLPLPSPSVTETTASKPPPAPPKPPLPPPPSPPGPSSDSKPDKTGFWIKKELAPFLFAMPLPSAPELDVTADGCRVNFTISKTSGNTDGFFVYRLDRTVSKFKRIATVDAGKASPTLKFTDASGQYGMVYYTVSSFNPAGESPGVIFGIAISDPGCIKPEETGIRLDSGKIVTTAPVDKVYCYLSASGDAGPWTRVPSASDSFILPKKGEFDVGEYIKSLAPSDSKTGTVLALECWGWQGSALIYLGKATMPLSTLGKIEISGEKFKVTGGISEGVLTTLPPSPKIMPPTGFAYTGSPTTCSTHWVASPTVESICAGLIRDSAYIVLVWDWSSACPTAGTCITDIDGYKVYRIDRKSKKHIWGATVLMGKTMTAFPWPTPSSEEWGDPTECFTVRAFKGMLESRDSNLVCSVGYPATWKAAKIKPASVSQNAHATPGQIRDADFPATIDMCKYPRLDPETSPLDVTTGWAGYTHRFVEFGFDDLCWTTSVYAYRSLVKFDLGELAGKPIMNATLKYKVGSSLVRDYWGRALKPVGACATSIFRAAESSAKYEPSGLLGREVHDDEIAKAGDTRWLNVTGVVKGWAEGQPNYGFLLQGIVPANVKDNSACLTYYSNFELAVDYGTTP